MLESIALALALTLPTTDLTGMVDEDTVCTATGGYGYNYGPVAAGCPTAIEIKVTKVQDGDCDIGTPCKFKVERTAYIPQGWTFWSATTTSPTPPAVGSDDWKPSYWNSDDPCNGVPKVTFTGQSCGAGPAYHHAAISGPVPFWLVTATAQENCAQCAAAEE